MNSSTPSMSSADAADSLERAIMYMVGAYLDQGLVPRDEIVNMLEEMIQKIERDPKRDS